MFNRKRRPKLKDQIVDLKEMVDLLKNDLKGEKERTTRAEKKWDDLTESAVFTEFREFKEAAQKAQQEMDERFEKRKKEWEEGRAEFEENLKKKRREYKNPKENWSEPPGSEKETEKERQQREYGHYTEETDAGYTFHYKKEPFKRDKAGGYYWKSSGRQPPPQRPYTRPGSPFKVLDLTPMATKTQIKARFRELAKKHHPDKEGGDSKKFNEITQAYQECLKMVI